MAEFAFHKLLILQRRRALAASSSERRRVRSKERSRSIFFRLPYPSPTVSLWISYHHYYLSCSCFVILHHYHYYTLFPLPSRVYQWSLPLRRFRLPTVFTTCPCLILAMPRTVSELECSHRIARYSRKEPYSPIHTILYKDSILVV